MPYPKLTVGIGACEDEDHHRTKQQLTSWIDTFVPEQDLFFIEEVYLTYFESELGDVLVLPRNEFMEHAVYKRLQLANSYLYWNIADRKSFVIAAPPKWMDRTDAIAKEAATA